MAHTVTIGVLVPTDGHAPIEMPEQRPIGRAALAVAQDDIRVIFGSVLRNGRIDGHQALSSGWKEVHDIEVDAVHDRFPSQIRASTWNRLKSGIGGRPMGNPMAFTLLCRDKLESQRAMVAQGISMPDVEANPSRFAECLSLWPQGFLKPRYGALGIGVKRIVAGDATTLTRPGVVPDRPDPSILQKGIAPPLGWAGRTVRVLVQRQPEGGWWQGTPVVRQSRTDPVCNAARGAEVGSGTALLSTACLDAIRAECAAVCRAFDAIESARTMVEAGLDLVLDAENRPHLIEINSRPRGRMERLASHAPATYAADHVEACSRPLRVLAEWSRTGQTGIDGPPGIRWRAYES